jgi:K+:H+ antiporter
MPLGALALVVIVIIFGKATILAAVVRAFGYWNIVPLAVGLTLFQVGEFGFVLARVGRSSGAIPNDIYTLTMNAAIVTMVLTPAVSNLVPLVYGRFWPRHVRETLEATNLPSAGLSARCHCEVWPCRPRGR